MSENSIRPIIIKRIKKTAAGHHGGAWKIAYADFVTAMMAFFLLMWLLGSTTQGDLEGISEYFKTPLKVAMAGGSGAGGSNSILNGGGKDLTRKTGQVHKNEEQVQSKKLKINHASIERAKLEKKLLSQLKERIQAAIEANPNLSKFKNQLLLDMIEDGLRIQIVDEKSRPMFAVSSPILEPYAKEILHEIGKMLNRVPNKISLSGHTDAHPYPKGEKSYGNWELSAERANASRRELIVGGMDETKLLQVVGLSSAVLFDKKDPLNPVNRRIAIIVMNEKAEQRIINEGVAFDVTTAEEAGTLVEDFEVVNHSEK